ncbi:unnamed protein product [Prunus armeniaca]
MAVRESSRISLALLSAATFAKPHKSNLCLGWSGLGKLTFTILTWAFGKGFWSNAHDNFLWKLQDLPIDEVFWEVPLNLEI